MAKVSFIKLNLKKNEDVKHLTINDQDIEIKQYLPVNEKLELISKVINKSADENNFANPVKLRVFLILEAIEAYTNINFTEKQKEDPTKLFDLFKGNGVANEIIRNIPVVEWNTLENGVNKCAEAIYTYRNSVLGLLETITADYSNLNLDAAEIQKNLADPNNMALLKDVLSKLG